MPPHKAAIGYARVAAPSPTAPRAGLDAQAAKIRARAKAQGIKLVRVVEDSGESAHDLKRPGLIQLFRALDASPIKVVIIADLTRLARSMSSLRCLLNRFARRGVTLIAVDDSLDTSTSEGRREVRALYRLASIIEQQSSGRSSIVAIRRSIS
jgi:DNA invertase Pin-like site-specific DNA recombinase